MTVKTTENSNGEQKLFQIPDDMADSKIYKKMVKLFGEDETRAFFKKSETELRAVMAECQVQAKEAQQAVQENEEFKRAVSTKKLFMKGLKEVVDPLKVKADAAAIVVAYNNEVRRAK